MLPTLRLACRQLIKQPGFTTVALATLAIGIGATIVTFSLVQAVLLRPFPAAAPADLVALNETNTARTPSDDMSISYANFIDWRKDNRTLSAVTLYEDASHTLSAGAKAEHLDGAVTTAEFFDVLGVKPALGRAFRPDEESPGGSRVVVLSHDTWMERFQSDPAVLGRILRLDGVPHTVVGVMPAGFRFPDNAALWTPIRETVTDDLRGSHNYDGVARLKPGVTVEQARADLNVIAGRLARAHPDTNQNIGAVVQPFVETMTANYRRIVLTLFGAVGCLLLITCVNLSGLLLARGAAREREIAVRVALGAGPGRIIRQLLTESILLGVLGGLLGTLLSIWALDLLAQLLVDDLPWWLHLTLDRTGLVFALGVSLLTSVGFGLIPALLLSRTRLGEALKQGSRSGSAHRAGLMRVLVGVQLTLALVLLSGAGLLLKSLVHLQQVRPGFRSDGVLSFTLNLPDVTYPDEARQMAVTARIVDKLQAVPGVESAAVVSNLPLGHNNWGRGFTLDDRPTPPPGQTPIANNRVISPDYFRVMQISLQAGRGFTAADSATAPKVVIVDETFARQYFPEKSPLGRRLHYGTDANDKPEWMEIVGVVSDVRHYDLRNSHVRAGIYVPVAQHSPTADAFYVIHTAGDPLSFAPAVREAVASVDHELASAGIQPMQEVVASAIWRDRLVSGIFAGFAGLALLLSILGVYGVTSFATGQRTREIGVRMALGAQPADVLRLVLGGGARLTVIALALGLAAALALAQLLSSQLFDVSPYDPLVLGGGAILLAGAATFACWLPARRATQVDPMVALRSE